jgi:hypothetical protein
MNIASAMNKLTVAFWQNSASIPSTSSFWAYSPSTGSGGRAAQGHVPWSNGHIYWDTAGCCGGDTRIEKLWEGDWSTWNHFAFVKNGDAKEIWINGELHHSGSNNGVLPGDISRLAVGAMIDSATSQGANSANSQIDDFKVFAQGLTQDQIKTLMGLPVDISAPGNAVVPSSDNHPGGEHAGLAIDNNSSTKYLNFDKLDTGLTITTGGGVVTGLGLTSANDAPERDPASFVLSGSNDGGATFTEIATGDIAAFGERFERQEVSFDNSTAYTTYRVVFPTVANAGAANSMQIAEIELLGTAAAGALTEPTVVDFGDLSGDASYEFFFNATKAGASTAIAGNNAFAFKLDQWNEQGVFGTTVFGVADNLFTAVEGKSVASVFDRDVHVVLVNDTAAGETRLYVDGDHVGVLDGNFELAGEVKVMGARIETNTDPMGDGSVMHKWAAYNSALSGAEIADLAAAAGIGGGDVPALSVVNNGDGTVTITFEGTLQSAPTVNGPWENVDAPSPLTISADQVQQYGRAVN